MGGEMRASLPGLQQLVGLTGRQVGYVDAIKAHVDVQAEAAGMMSEQLGHMLLAVQELCRQGEAGRRVDETAGAGF